MPSPPAPTLAFVEYITKLPSYEEIVFGVDFLSVDIAVVDCRVSFESDADSLKVDE
jgi:hypothetical protein